ncbi:MAG: S8 family serine peptidase [Burkholderiales bacterium]|nr:S8 family serine peptidase [Burkholderiales bacterium]
MITTRSWRPRTTLAACAAAVLAAACGGGSETGAPTEQPNARVSAAAALPPQLARLRAGGAAAGVLAPSLRQAKGQVDVWVTLAEAPVAAHKEQLRPPVDEAASTLRASDDALRAELRSYRRVLRDKQDATLSSLSGLGARELGRVQVAHNAVAVRVDAARLTEIAAMPGVLAVRPVRHYQLDLSETVPYVGAAAAQTAGKTGAGIRVAVMDSGIDYTHRNLGGAGTAEAYEAAYGTGPGDARQTTRDGLFPTAKVVDGFDFVGEAWPNADRTEDEDPIDFEGHGTHVADIIAGVGPSKGMAPGAKLVAIKVCSAVATSCNGVALLRGVDFALDPNGDGSLQDAVDVINLSLGSSYGQEEDDLSFALANAVRLGVSVVASAGNSADRPYITGSPSTARGVISVAQTQVPGAVAYPLVVNSPAAIAGPINNTATVEWAPVGSGFAGTVKLASSVAADNLACTALPSGSMGGFVALIDRGACAVSVKVHNAASAGAIGVLVANNAPGDPPSFSFGGPDPFTPAPTIIITQADGAKIKANIAAPVTVSVSPSVSVPLVGSMVASSSRGPGYSDSALKPEIGAPGASVSAIVGSGTGEEAFGGTSGAAPMVSGAAAILRGAFPNRSPVVIKAMLMNSAETAIQTNPATMPGVLAPISRIGAGELRVDRALALKGVVFDSSARSAAAAFGFAEVDRSARLQRELTVRNFTNQARTYTVAVNYRYADDGASGATTIDVPTTVTVPPNGSRKIRVSMRVDGSKLPAWNFGNAGADGGNGALLQGNEVDGYLSFSADGETLSVPFHALLRKSSSIELVGSATQPGEHIRLFNRGVNDGAFDVFALTGTSPRIPRIDRAEPGANFTMVDLRAVGVRAFPDDDAIQFAVSRWDRRTHPAYPAGIEIYVDSNNDGTPDYAVFNAELGAFASTGQTVVYVANLSTGGTAAYYFLDADLQSGNGIFTVPMSAIGLTATTQFRFDVYAWDNYFTGNYTDAIEGMVFTPGTPRYELEGDVIDGVVPARVQVRMTTRAVAGGAAASPSQRGFLLTYRQNAEVETDVVRLR